MTKDKKSNKKNGNRAIYRFFKRIFDIVVGFIGSIFLIPIIIFVKILYICTGDFHSIFLVQRRIGKGGKEFNLFKFRTMVLDADDILKKMLDENSKVRYEYKVNKKIKNDPRITKAGRLLRKFSIDELPQIINIFIGNMSLIGNRPYLPREKEQMGISYETIVSTKPGLTGYWQVSGRSNLSFSKRLKLEKYYSENCCLKMDIIIFFKTFKAIFSATGAE